HPNRIQLIGRTELAYFRELGDAGYQSLLEKLFAAHPAAILLADAVGAEQRLSAMAERHDTPLLASPLPDDTLLDEVQYYLTRALARRETLHGVFMEVLGTGVLLRGSAGAGKSELALALITRGHRLIADDAPEFARITPDIVQGTCPPLLQDFIEVRGLGILNIRAMFGDSAIKPEQQLQLVIHLQPVTPERLRGIDRLHGSYSSHQVLDLEIPEVTLPVAPGREIAILVEAAVHQYILRRKGYDAADEFIERQRRILEEAPTGKG
ncbi:MAG TPA: HPr(Ser) kinase/phosphatase, partial [Sedimenticola sp.]|nr:HPr(Ser) kinase/phosphatase [Sedimenticola sp.]